MRHALMCCLVAAVSALSGCSTPYREPVEVQGGPPYDGLVDALARSQGKPVELVLVHGMCTPENNWVDRITAALVQAMDSQAVAPAPAQQAAPGGAALAADAEPRVKITTQEMLVAGGRLHVSALTWSPLTQPLKARLSDDLTGTPTDCAAPGVCKPQRAWLNGLVKDELLNDCLADVMVTEGLSRVAVRQHIAVALTQVLQAAERRAGPPDAKQTPPQLILLTQSLGSHLAFGALELMRDGAVGERGKAAEVQMQRQLAQVFMAANQMPILALAGQSIAAPPTVGAAGAANAASAAAERTASQAGGAVDAATAVGGDAMARWLRRWPGRPQDSSPQSPGIAAERSAPPPWLSIVAFTDPNDLLSYRVAPSLPVREDVRVTDVLVSNAPTLLGLAENPLPAHSGYIGNRKVLERIACGSPRSERCR